jgi:hypothetical protein
MFRPIKPGLASNVPSSNQYNRWIWNCKDSQNLIISVEQIVSSLWDKFPSFSYVIPSLKSISGNATTVSWPGFDRDDRFLSFFNDLCTTSIWNNWEINVSANHPVQANRCTSLINYAKLEWICFGPRSGTGNYRVRGCEYSLVSRAVLCFTWLELWYWRWINFIHLFCNVGGAFLIPTSASWNG